MRSRDPLELRNLRMKPDTRSALILASPSIAWLVLFAAVPCLFMLLMSFLSTGIFGIQFKLTWHNVEQYFSTPLYSYLLFKTFRISIFTTIITLVAAYPVALILSRQRGALKSALILFLFLPFWIGYV